MVRKAQGTSGRESPKVSRYHIGDKIFGYLLGACIGIYLVLVVILVTLEGF